MIPLPPSQVHLWCCRTDIGEHEVPDRLALLSEQERARAARFHDMKTAIAFTAAHGWLRRVLAAYLDVTPQHLRFSEGPFGKPELDVSKGSWRAVAFNLSHSGNLAIVAVTAGMPIGIDIERIVAMPVAFAAECLAAGEVAALEAVAPRDRDEAFMRCWTRKEAYLKAIGTGLNTPLGDFEVSVDPSAPTRLLRVGSDTKAAAHWQLADLKPAPGYCGAVAARALGWACVWMARPGARPLAYDGRLMTRQAATPF